MEDPKEIVSLLATFTLEESRQWACLAKIMEEQLSSRRMAHTMRVVRSGADLVERFGGCLFKVLLACLLHDGAKEYSNDVLLEMARTHDLFRDPSEEHNPAVLHGPVAAWQAAQEWGVEDPVILEAIRCHTTGEADMSLEASIVFMADLIEPGRRYVRVEALRDTTLQDLRAGMLLAIEETYLYLERKKIPVHQGMVACQQWLLANPQPWPEAVAGQGGRNNGK